MNSAIRAALAARGQPISMAAVRLCLEYAVGLPAKMQQTAGNPQLIIQPSLPIGTDPLAVEVAQDAGWWGKPVVVSQASILER